MINTIQDAIDALENIKKVTGNIFIRTQCQVSNVMVEFDYSIEEFWNENKTVSIKVFVIKGYKIP